MDGDSITIEILACVNEGALTFRCNGHSTRPRDRCRGRPAASSAAEL
jgi:hypothetical protein